MLEDDQTPSDPTLLPTGPEGTMVSVQAHAGSQGSRPCLLAVQIPLVPA